MSKRFVNPALSGPWCLVFLISLIWQLSGPVHAQSQPQVDLTGKNTLGQGPGVSGASGQSDLASKKVLILHSFAYAQPVYKIIDAGPHRVVCRQRT